MVVHCLLGHVHHGSDVVQIISLHHISHVCNRFKHFYHLFLILTDLIDELIFLVFVELFLSEVFPIVLFLSSALTRHSSTS